MSKLKSPFLSMGAHGTIGDAITTQRRGQDTIVRTKPIPAYRRTLPQVYQRWLYEDYAYLWTQQTEATQREYAAAGSRFHLTGFQYWMKYNLTHLPDIIALYHLDFISGASLIDFSRNSLHATNLGASIMDGVIDKALLFWLNDALDCSNNLLLQPDEFTVEAFIKGTYSDAVTRTILARGTGGAITAYHYWIYIYSGKLTFFIADGTNWNGLQNMGAFTDDKGYHVAATLSATKLKVYQSGQLLAPTANRTIDPNITAKTSIGGGDEGTDYFAKFMIDHLIIYNRALDDAEILRHSLRRYPA